MPIGWRYLLVAGLFEIGFAVCLKQSDGFARLWPTLGFLAFGIVSFFLLTRAMQTVPIGTAYAVWTGIGAAGTVLAGAAFFSEPLSAARIAFLMTLIGSIIGLKLVSGDGPE